MNKLGNVLKERGVEKGGRIGIQLPECFDLIKAFFAILKIGAMVVPANPSLRAPDLAYIYQDTGMTTLICSSQHIDRIKSAMSEALQ